MMNEMFMSLPRMMQKYAHALYASWDELVKICNCTVSPLSSLKPYKRGTFTSFIKYNSFWHFSNLESRSYSEGSSQSKFRFQHSISFGSKIHGAIKPSGS